MTRQRRYYQRPPIVPTPLDDVWSVLVPAARTNLVINPSFETNTTSWTAIGGSIARSTTQQYHGSYSLAITPTATTNDGARFDTVSLTSTTLYAYSAKVLGQKNVSYKLAIETTGGSELASVVFTATGRWQWIWGYYLESATTTRRVTLRKNGSASTAVIYLDGVQVEALTDASNKVSTYIDGDQLGLVPNQSPPAYVWNGTPHASTSTRSGLTRAGGEVVRFKDYGFSLSAIIGLGLAGVQNVATEYARLDGGYDDYTRKPTRQFSIVGRFDGRSYDELRANRRLAALFDRDLVAQDQRLTLLHYIENDCGVVTTNTSRILAKYQDGLGGSTNGQVAEQTPVTFVNYQPAVMADGENGASLAVQTSTASVNNIAKRTSAGVWEALSSGLNSSAQDILISRTGLVYVTGAFSTAGGGAAAGIATWNPTTGAWSALGSGLTGAGATGYALAEAPNGDIYVGGDFTNGGGSGADYIAKYTPSTTTWSVVGSATSIANIVRTLTMGPTGILYVGGDFINADGNANADRIATWDGSAWGALGSGMNDIVRSIVVAPSGTIYACGDFTTADGNSAVKIASWNGSAWSAMGAGLTGGGTNRGFKMAMGKNGILYVGGTFTAAGGVTASNIASWNGVTFAPLGSGVTSDPVINMVVTPDNQLIISGNFTSAGGFNTTGGLARWTGAAWVPIESNVVGSPVAKALALTPGGDLYLSALSGTMVSAGLTTVNNIGSARCYMVVTIKGPSSGTSRVYSILNNTTGRAVFLNYTINSGETAVLVLQPDSLSFVSDFQGNIARYVMPGSTPADFALQPGNNVIGVYSANSTVTATAYWRPAFASLDDVQ